MLYNLTYKEQDTQKQMILSGNSFASVIVYCDAKNITPISISEQKNMEIILNQPTSQTPYLVTFSETGSDRNLTIIYDSFENVVTWINQSGKQLQSIITQKKGFDTI